MVTWTPHSTYRGIAIYEGSPTLPLGGPYRAKYDGSWHTAPLLSTVHERIDTHLGGEAPTDDYQPFGDYRGCTLFRYVSNPLYGSSCTTERRDNLDLVRADIDALLGPIPEPEWELKEIYNGLAIYFWPSTDEYRGYYVGKAGVMYGPYTLQRCRDKIDELQGIPKKPTDLTITVYPRTGSPPYDTRITTELISNGDLLSGKRMILYKDDNRVTSKVTDINGKAVFLNTVIDDATYYTYFAGDAIYEGCSTEKVN